LSVLRRDFPADRDNYQSILNYAKERQLALMNYRNSTEYGRIRNYFLNYSAEVKALEIFISETLARKENNKIKHEDTDIVKKILTITSYFDKIRRQQKQIRVNRPSITYSQPNKIKPEEDNTTMPRFFRKWERELHKRNKKK
jgi:hypothetical protein